MRASRTSRTGRGAKRRVPALLAAGALLALTLCAPVSAAPAPAPAAPAVTPLRTGDAAAPPANLTAKDWVVADADSGAILAASHLHDRDMPASTMKILTALTILPNLPPDQVVTVGPDSPQVDGTKVGLVPGVGYSVRDLATAMLISSGNDATVALVDADGGSAAVLARMNTLAGSLGAHDTVAGDPTGLDSPGQLTSVHDLAVLGRAAIHEPSVRPYLTVPRASLPGRGDQRFEIQNHNLLLNRYEGTIGVKNGYTVAAGATFVGAATRAGRTLVVALLRTAPEFDRDARALLDWGFAHGSQITPVGYLPDAATGLAASAAGAGPAGAAARTAPRADALPAPKVDEHGGILHGIGPTTWIAVCLTVAALLLTMATRRLGRRTRRARAARAAAMRARFAAQDDGGVRPGQIERPPLSRERRPNRPGYRPDHQATDRRLGRTSTGRPIDRSTAPVRRPPAPAPAPAHPHPDPTGRGEAHTDELYYDLPREPPRERTYEAPRRRPS
ncbi:serine hydrolase [Frankia sp. AgPm24]|uniref:D-alanyl-D-alanine carboxypeptidase family protein n=1 Tax=Frankia sp. AgPm24 TaxID=631128 RepID=UPI00200DA200|nr:serine hydrolase [Frankia sp. AgPm24]MCK9922930.1 serine hydrolase [Frankia sp. AgPm24]